MTARSHTAPTRPRSLLTTLAAAQLLIGLDYNIVFVALPDIAGLGFTPATLQWVVASYAIAFGGFLLLGGRLSDTIGRRRVFVGGLSLYVVGSVVGTCAPAGWTLIAGRALQGLGGALLAPATLSLVTTSFDEGHERNRALGVWGAAGSAGMVLGSILGGLLTDQFGWRAVFAVNVPIAALIVFGALRSIPADRARASARLDLPGAALTAAAASLAVLGFTVAADAGWTDPAAVAASTFSVGAFVVLLIVEGRTAEPLFDVHRLRSRTLAVGTASTFLFMAGFGATAYFLTLYYQDDRGLSALSTGLAFVVPCVGVLLGTTLGARLSTAAGMRASMITGNVIGLIGVGLIGALVDARSALALVIALTAIFSVGQGIVFVTMFAVATAGVPDSEQGVTSGLATTGQQLGGAIGLAVLVTVVSSSSSPGLNVAMIGIGAVVAVALALSLLAPGKSRVAAPTCTQSVRSG